MIPSLFLKYSFSNQVIARHGGCEAPSGGRSPFGDCIQSPVGQGGADRTTSDPVGLSGSRLKKCAFPHLMRDRVAVRGPASSAARRVPLKGPFPHLMPDRLVARGPGSGSGAWEYTP